MGEYNEIDLKFSQEGDLVLDEPLRNEDGNIIKDKNGKAIRDIALTEDTESLEQDIYNRIMTNAPEWSLHPEIGGNLEDLIGERNTRENANIGASNIEKTLTFDKRITSEDLSIRAVPTGHDQVTFFLQVFVDNRIDPLLIPIPFNFVRGMLD